MKSLAVAGFMFTSWDDYSYLHGFVNQTERGNLMDYLFFILAVLLTGMFVLIVGTLITRAPGQN